MKIKKNNDLLGNALAKANKELMLVMINFPDYRAREIADLNSDICEATRYNRKSISINMMGLCFDEDINNILTPEEVIFTQLCINDFFNYTTTIDGYFNKFIDSIAFKKLFEFYIDEMPYGTAKARTGEPDVWILNKLHNRCNHNGV